MRWESARARLAIVAVGLAVLAAACGTPDQVNETTGGPAGGAFAPTPCAPTTSDPGVAGTAPTSAAADTAPGAVAGPGGTAPAAGGSTTSPVPSAPSTATTAAPRPCAPGSTTGTTPPGTGGASAPGSTGAPTTTAVPVIDYAGAADTLTLGGPGATVGNDLDPARCPQFQPDAAAPCGPQPMYWSAINGPFDPFPNGDPVSTRCGGGENGTSCQGNALYRSSGHAFAIDVAPADVGRPLAVEVYDLGVSPRATAGTPVTTRGPGAAVPPARCDLGQPPFTTTAQAGRGFGTGNCQTGDDGAGQNMDVEVFDNGGTDGSIRFDRSLPGCHLTVAAADLDRQADTYRNRWVRTCTFTPTQVGVHALRVRNSDLPGLADAGTGTNAFSLRVVGGTASRLYPVGEQSVFMNVAGATATLPLARVPSRFAGHHLVIDAFDPGDGMGSSGRFTVQVRPPGGAAPWAGSDTGPACTYNATPSAQQGPDAPDVADRCTVVTRDGADTSTSRYNGKWLRIVVDLDPGYRCDADCYWSLVYDFGGGTSPTDRVTWSAAID